MVPSDVRPSNLVSKHIKRGIAIFIHSIKFIAFDWLQIKFASNQDSCFQGCVYVLKYIRYVESDVLWELQKLDRHTTISPLPKALNRYYVGNFLRYIEQIGFGKRLAYIKDLF